MEKALVIYYSLEGNVDFVARELAKELGADTFRLETVKDYPKQGLVKFFHGGKDAIAGSRPELKALPPDLAPYGTIVLGTPVWAGRPAAPLNTLLAACDFAGKRVAAFASSAGGNPAKTFEVLAAKLHGAPLTATASFKNPARAGEAALSDIKAFAAALRQGA